MHLHTSASLRILLVVFAISLLRVAPGLCQDTSSSVMAGLTPYADYHGSEIDSIGLRSGGLSLHIPILADHSQRGQLNFTYSVVSSGSSWELVQTLSNPATYIVKAAGLAALSGRWAPTLAVDGGGLSLRYSVVRNNNGNGVDFYYVQESNGAVHHMGNLTSAAVFSGYPKYLESIDGTAIRATILSTSSVNIIRRDGVQFNTSGLLALPTTTVDPNGNQISTPSGSLATMVDTLGRTWSQATTTDFSHCPVAASSAMTWTIPATNGGVAVYKFCTSDINIQTSFTNLPANTQQASGTTELMTGVVLPNLTTWRLDYNSYGDVVKVTLPTGGSIAYQYAYGGLFVGDPTTGSVTSRTVSDGTNSATWNYGTSTGASVTDPLGNDIVVTGFAACSDLLSQIKYYSGPLANGNILKTVTKTYTTIVDPFISDMGSSCAPNPALPLSTTTSWANGQVTKEQRTYDPGFPFYDYINGTFYCPSGCSSLYGLVVSDSNYDYGSGAPGAVLATKNTNYVALSNSNYLTANLLELPSSVVTLTGSGYKCAETDYGYDDSARLFSSGITEQHAAAPASVRGNLTSVTRQLSTTPCQSSAAWTPTTSFRNVYDTGMLYQDIDPLGHPATYSYSSNYFGAYPTTITNALTQNTIITPDFNTGLPASTKDLNGQTTSITYDSMRRLSSASYPDGGQDTITHQESSFPYGATLTRKITSNQNYVRTSIFDGLGRPILSTLTSDPDGTTYNATVYDALGRVGTVYNPTRCSTPTTNCGESTWGYISTTYDALNRSTKVTKQDGQIVTTTYAGNCATLTDEAGKARKSCSDALDRLTQVFEDPAGLNYETDYTYDALDNLLTVNQKGGSTNSALWRTRDFAYDGLSRLTSASNPESGSAAYTYDANGNLASRTSPAPNQTGTATVTLSYCYDALNRLTSKAYTSQSCPMSSPVATYSYDQTSYNGLTIANGIGRRTGMTDQAGSEVWSYDPMGRIAADQRTTNGVTLNTPYTYNLDGSIATITYPALQNPLTVTFTPGGAGRPLSEGSADDGAYAINAHYAPNGSLCFYQQGWGASSTTDWTFNNRFQPLRIFMMDNYSSTPPSPCTNPPSEPHVWMDLTYSHTDASGHNNGNVASITNGVDPDTTQLFSYDSLNRIATAKTQGINQPAWPGDTEFMQDCWGEQFGYDPWGNLLSISSVSSSYTGCTQENLGVAVNTNNQIIGNTYDAAGNLMIAQPGNSQYTYDVENHLTSTAGQTYLYDGDGKRVEKATNGTPLVPNKLYWYDQAGNSIYETDANGNEFDRYFYFAGRLVNREEANDWVNQYGTDALGNVRFLYGTNGQFDIIDYYPFGGERIIQSNSSNSRLFTGKERDSESGLDNFGARYNSSQYGRFMSPDPLAGHTEDPQTLNRYSYVRNNPLNLTDPTGLDFNLQCGRQSDTCQKDSNGNLVQGTTTRTTDANGNTTSTFAATVVTSASLQDPNSGNTATVNQNGVQITTASGTSQGVFISDTPAANNVQGSGAFTGVQLQHQRQLQRHMSELWDMELQRFPKRGQGLTG